MSRTLRFSTISANEPSPPPYPFASEHERSGGNPLPPNGIPDHHPEAVPEYAASAAPPTYQARSAALPTATAAAALLESSRIATSAGSAPTQTAHHFHLRKDRSKANGRPWASLLLLSAAASPTNQPRFHEGARVTGSVALDLESSEYVQAIKVVITGRFISGTVAQHSESRTFLEHTHTLWTREMGDPRFAASMALNEPFPGSAKPFNGHLVAGEYGWSFEFAFPSTVGKHTSSARPYGAATNNSATRVTSNSTSTIRLPHTFLEHHGCANIQYDLTVRIARGRLCVDSKIHSMIAYIPSMIAPSFTVHRAQAYAANAPVPGPVADPAGWRALPAVRVTGQVFGARPVALMCRVSRFYLDAFHTVFSRSYVEFVNSVLVCLITYAFNDDASNVNPNDQRMARNRIFFC
ncbi:hypothetical protein HGRIS_002135 [Hohenbuehelia grisea]|uniref:Arrestin-like N-terminal domain-containing protein n=1 Tax=Hohenbuehelia grisea TaxID=104357 RepID=A0ABR3JKS6_9AGAR